MIKKDLFDSLLEPVFILNQNSEVLYCNETAATLCGSSVRKIIRQKQKLEELFVFDEKVEWINQLNSVQDPTPYKELRFKNLNQDEGRVQITCQPYKDESQEPQWIVFVRDVTLEERLQKKYRGELEQKEGVIAELQKAQAELQNYSKNLESMVEERTHEIRKLNGQMKALLDSLSQGFLIFDREGNCLPAYSQACLRTLEKSPEGKKIWDVLSLDEANQDLFKRWMSTVFEQLLPFEDLKPLGPDQYAHSEGRNIALDYFPILSPLTEGEQQSLHGVVLVANDITELRHAQRQAEKEKKLANFILDLVQKQGEIARFVHEAQKIIEQILLTTQSTNIVSHQDQLFRWIHTLKGGSGSFTIGDLAERCHEAEEILSLLKTDSSPFTIKKLIQHINGIQRTFDEFMTEARKILGPKALSSERYVPVKLQDLRTWADQLELWSRGQKTSHQIYANYIYEPLQSFVSPYDEMMLRLAERQGKKLNPIEFSGVSLTLPGQIYNSLFGTFVHLFRNIVDHGLESPEARLQAGKSESGRVRVYCSEIRSKDRKYVLLEVADDGRGIDPQVIRNKLENSGRSTAKESDLEVIQHIFESQFSTRQEVTEISGRGVGLDAVKFEVEKLGGKIWVESTPGTGTRFFVQWPMLSTRQAKQIA